MRLKLLIIALVASIAAWADTYSVDASTLNLRVAPSASAPVASTVSRGETVEVISFEGDWARVTYGGAEYYVAAKYLTPAESEPQVVAVATEKESWLDDFKLASKEWQPRIAHSSEVPFYIALALLICFAAVHIFGDENTYDDSCVFYIGAVGFLILCFFEFYYFAGYTGDVTWFCSPDSVGWLWTIVNFLLFAFLCFIQVMTYVMLTAMVHYHGGRRCNVKTGYILTLVAIGAFIISGFFFQQYATTVIAVDLVALLGWLIWMGYCNYRDGGSWLNLMLAIALWVVGAAATLIMLFHFVVMLILVICAAIAGYIVLGMMGASSGKRSSSSDSDDDSSYQSGLGASEEERTFLVGSDGERIEVEESSWTNTAKEKGVAFGRTFHKDSSGNWVED